MINKSIVFLFLFMAISFISKAQKPELVPAEKKPKQFLEYYIGEYKFKERNNWVTFGFGPNFYPSISNFTNANMSLDIHFFDKQDRLWNGGYQAHSRNYLAFGGASVYLHEFKFGRGFYRVEKQYWKVAAFAGPSVGYSNYFPTDTTKTIKGDKEIGFGVQAKVELIYKPVYDFGIAIVPFINVNTIQTVAGITICVYGSNALVKQIKN